MKSTRNIVIPFETFYNDVYTKVSIDLDNKTATIMSCSQKKCSVVLCFIDTRDIQARSKVLSK